MNNTVVEEHCRSELDRLIKRNLIELGFTSKHVGFNYLCKAVELAVKKPELKYNLCNGLYSNVASDFSSTKDRVERNIRHAIENTYINKNFLKINDMFGMNIFTINDKPTNGEFISLLAEYYLLELYK